MSRKPFTTLKETLYYCFTNEIQSDIALIPPKVDNLTDEEIEVEQPEASPSAVRNAMSRNTYLELKSAFHVQDNSQAQNNNKDKSFKVRPLVELFSLYCGKETNDNQPIDPLRTHKNMLSVVTNPNPHPTFFDNIFIKCEVVGGFEEKRIPDNDKRNRGSHDYAFHEDNAVVLVRWKDNKCVTMPQIMILLNRWFQFKDATKKKKPRHQSTAYSVITSRFGSNNNTTCRQFEAVYKTLSLHTEIKDADSGNAVALDNTSILCCSNNNLTHNNSGDDLLDSEDFVHFGGMDGLDDGGSDLDDEEEMGINDMDFQNAVSEFEDAVLVGEQTQIHVNSGKEDEAEVNQENSQNITINTKNVRCQQLRLLR
ncbi:hypothetical protein ILUMI_07819 [Ignelater luminosus]|uniref:Transposable element P transposase-like RNase H C-terminal domain-containing protein n=1 Tax=Ignelater luminosus TaxID=2038154 RepID=A0A8K0GGH3_IGNLU|nr:hypothetical protein ILUMI_07819 [Ignelater luminosus]